MSYQGHHRYLDLYHPYRRQMKAFNGEQEFGCAPEPLSGEKVLGQQQQLRFSFGKGEAKKGGVSMEKISAACVLVPGEFGDHGVKGMILAANYARENKVPYLGIFLGMQISVLGLEKPNSSEFDAQTLDPVVIFMPEGRSAKMVDIHRVTDDMLNILYRNQLTLRKPAGWISSLGSTTRMVWHPLVEHSSFRSFVHSNIHFTTTSYVPSSRIIKV
ncbi:hypothetical protein AgCh_024949 [Apium graveolens]